MKSGIPWRIVFRKDFPSRSEAVQLEIEIKKRGARRFLADLGLSAVG
jgi:putative endonuclease